MQTVHQNSQDEEAKGKSQYDATSTMLHSGYSQVISRCWVSVNQEHSQNIVQLFHQSCEEFLNI